MAKLPRDTITHYEHDGKGNINITITDLIRCKDCRHRQDPNICPMTLEEWVEIDEGDGCYDSDYILHDNTIDDGFCDRGDSDE